MQPQSRRLTKLIFGLVQPMSIGAAVFVTALSAAQGAQAQDDDVPMLPAPTATPASEATRAQEAAQAQAPASTPAAKNPPGSASAKVPPAAPRSTVVSITKVVGEVGDQFVTSREVKIDNAIEQALNKKPGSPDGTYQVLAGNERFFPAEVTRALDEWAVYFEARSLGSTSVQKADVTKAVGTVEERWSGHQGWKELEVGQDELRRMIERKLAAREFQKLKSDPSMSPVSDDEALAYYKKNRLRFGSLPFSSFQENIKAFLVKTQVEKRLSEWHEVLRRKYKTRNFISG